MRQDAGNRAFIPEPLPPRHPPMAMDQELAALLSAADRSVGRLDGVTEVLPNPDLFVAMYVHKEAVLSSQIEGTQSSLADVLTYQADRARRGLPFDVTEVVNHVSAMNRGLERVRELPLSLRLIREIHEELLTGVRGSERSPGEFRRSQNWIGGRTIHDAVFVPPPPHEVVRCMGELETFVHDTTPMPVLIKAALVHAQFETIHPFLDGNGRIGRLLITFFLCHEGVLQRPLLYISHYFRKHRSEYYDRLQAVRDAGDWEGWLAFFLRAVAAVADDAVSTARRILALRTQHQQVIADSDSRSLHAQPLFDHLFLRPILTVAQAAEALGVAFSTASNLIDKFQQMGIIAERTGFQRNRLFAYEDYLQILAEDEGA